MEWKKFGLIAGYLTLTYPSASFSQVDARFQPAPTNGIASVQGTVQDAVTKKPVLAAIVLVKTQEGTVRAQQRTSADGRYLFKIDPKQAYLLTVEADGYELHDEQLTFTTSKVELLTKPPILLYKPGTKPNTQQATTVASTPTNPQNNNGTGAIADGAANARVTPPKTLDAKVTYVPPLVVEPVGKPTQLKALQFVQSKAELLPDAMPGLEQLLLFMQANPTAEIELSGHTDNQGDFDENVRLSKQRVDVVKAYLVQNGIATNRIATRGYGPTRPIASNNSEATRQLNRRVEMVVLKK